MIEADLIRRVCAALGRYPGARLVRRTEHRLVWIVPPLGAIEMEAVDPDGADVLYANVIVAAAPARQMRRARGRELYRLAEMMIVGGIARRIDPDGVCGPATKGAAA